MLEPSPFQVANRYYFECLACLLEPTLHCLYHIWKSCVVSLCTLGTMADMSANEASQRCLESQRKRPADFGVQETAEPFCKHRDASLRSWSKVGRGQDLVMQGQGIWYSWEYKRAQCHNQQANCVGRREPDQVSVLMCVQCFLQVEQALMQSCSKIWLFWESRLIVRGSHGAATHNEQHTSQSHGLHPSHLLLQAVFAKGRSKCVAFVHALVHSNE